MSEISDLRYQRNLVALETNTLSVDIDSILKRTIPGIAESFAGFVSKFSAKDSGVHLTSDQQGFIKNLKQFQYMDLEPITAYVPEGMDQTYLEFANVLDHAVNYVKDTPARLDTFCTYLAALVTNREQRLVSKNNVRTYLELERNRAEIAKDLGHCFKNGSTKAEVRYGDVIKRNADWELVFGSVEKINAAVNSVNRSKLNEKAKFASEMLEKIMQMERRGDLNGTAAEVVSELSEGAYQLASELEFFAVVYYRVTGLTESVNSTVKNVKRIMDR